VSDQETPLFARSPMGGKRTAKAEARITEETKEAMRRKCHELGITESDYLDRLICVSLYGIDHVLNVERHRTAMVCGLSAHGLQGAAAA
jgi:hypothetical protein